MSRIFLLGATGSLGSQVLRLALAGGHQVTVFVRTPSKLPADVVARVTVHTGDLCSCEPAALGQLVNGHDVLINCAGYVTEGEAFVALIDRLVTAVEALPPAARPVCWFLAGAALLDLDASGRQGEDLPFVRKTYWPHRVNLARLARTDLDWRLLCPGPMVEAPALGIDKLRLSLDRLPVPLPAGAGVLPGLLLAPVFASLIPQMIVPYADAAALMLANLDRGSAMRRRRVGLALPPGMRGSKRQWANRA